MMENKLLSAHSADDLTSLNDNSLMGASAGVGFPSEDTSFQRASSTTEVRLQTKTNPNTPVKVSRTPPPSAPLQAIDKNNASGIPWYGSSSDYQLRGQGGLDRREAAVAAQVANSSVNLETPLMRTYSPYTPRGMILFMKDKVQPGSIKGSMFNIIISTVGGGVLSLAYGVRVLGLVPGLLVLCLSAALSYFTLDLLLIVARYLPEQTKPSYMSMSLACSPEWGDKLQKFVQGMLVIQMFGGNVSYVVAFGGLVDLVWGIFFGGSVYVETVLIANICIIWPLSLMKSMSSLRFTSLLGFACSAYLCLILFIEYWMLCAGDPSADIATPDTCFWHSGFHLPMQSIFAFTSFWGFCKRFLVSVPLFFFAYTCHHFMLPIYVELQRRSIRRMRKVNRRAFASILLMYLIAAIFGFLTFVDGTCGNVLLNDFHKHAEVVIAAITISISMILANPVVAFAWRLNFSTLFYGSKELSTVKHFVITTVFTALNMIVALFVTDITVPFSLLGSSTYPTIGFVLPGVFFWNIVPPHKYPIRRKIAAVVSVAVITISLCGLAYQIYGYTPGSNMHHITDCNSMQTIKTPDFFGAKKGDL